MLTRQIDELDSRLIHSLAASPRAGILELARQLGVARGTVQARLNPWPPTGGIPASGPTPPPPVLSSKRQAFSRPETPRGSPKAEGAHLPGIPGAPEATGP